MRDYPELLILRHGETEWNRAGRMQGALDSPLTDRGRAQARAQGDILRDFGIETWSAFASPQGRAAATAEIALGQTHAITLDPRLVEIDIGRWNGEMKTQIMADAPHLFDDPDGMIWYDQAPGGEGLAGLEARAAQFLNDLTGPCVVVTHGITSRVMRCILLGRAAEEFDQMPGGQGVVYHLRDGVQKQLSLGA